MKTIIFIHGLESSGKGFKANFLRKKFSSCLTPTFFPFDGKISYSKLLEIRMTELHDILVDKDDIILIGSSYGGLMATLYIIENRKKVCLLVLLAPFLSFPAKALLSNSKIDVLTIIFHGTSDEIISIESTKAIATRLFTNLEFYEVNDDHMLHSTVQKIDWKNLLDKSQEK